MVGIGVLMVADRPVEPVAALARGGSTRARWLLRLAVLMGPSGFVAVLAGWITTEVGPPALHRLRPAAHGAVRLAHRRAGGRRLARSPSSSSTSSCSAPASFYILRLMAQARREPHEPDIEHGMPMRAAGITPAPALAAADGARPRAREDEVSHG